MCEIPHQLERGTSASEYPGSQGGWGVWIVRSHIDLRGEQVLVWTLGPEGGWIVRFHVDWRGE